MVPPKSTALQPEQWTPFLSPYLMGGYGDDHLVLREMTVAADAVQGILDVDRFFMPADGRYHLSVPLAFAWTAQLAIIHGCIDNQLTHKQGEIYVRDYRLQCRRVVDQTTGILFDLQLRRRREIRRRKTVFYDFDVDVCAGSFVGRIAYPLGVH